jgi:hypothetical protein
MCSLSGNGGSEGRRGPEEPDIPLSFSPRHDCSHVPRPSWRRWWSLVTEQFFCSCSVYSEHILCSLLLQFTKKKINFFFKKARKEKKLDDRLCVCVLITAVPNTKPFACGEGDSGGHVLRETTSRGLCGLVCPSRTRERGGEGDCVKEGGGGECATVC